MTRQALRLMGQFLRCTIVLSCVAGCSKVAQSTQPSQPVVVSPVRFVDVYGRAYLSLIMTGPNLGRFTLSLRDRGSVFGRFSPSESDTPVVTLRHLTFPVVTSTNHHNHLRLSGSIEPNAHQAHLAIRLDSPTFATRLDTSHPNPKQAMAKVAQVIAALSATDTTKLASLIDPAVLDGRSATEEAGILASQGVHVISVSEAGSGRLSWLASGFPVWTEPIEATATTSSGTQTLAGKIVLIDQDNAWWLFSWVDSH